MPPSQYSQLWPRHGVLSVLSIIGGDVVQRAIAQLAGSGPSYFTPVAFSFGWVAYSFSALLSAVGEGRLMPPSDCPSIVVNAENGYVRTNMSWPLGRLLRDHRSPHYRSHSGLTVSMYFASKSKPAGIPRKDWVYYSGIAVIVAQLVISVVPWRAEKWKARPVGKREIICLTRGNGSNSVIVIVSDETGIRLEDLAAARLELFRSTSIMTLILATLWIVHLLTVQTLQDDAWFLLGIGGLGMIQNLIAAGASRSAAALGFHLERPREVHDDKVFKALQEAEELERGVGVSLIPVFFPGGLRADEKKWVDETEAENAAFRRAQKNQAQQSLIVTAAFRFYPIPVPSITIVLFLSLALCLYNAYS
ncbi:uncharacterized protein EDB91DRAFT_1330743 [Suillus paluster]|uniref:uncharacterized protein n=1 Tax=Suillus paluster TaxID=48578 RepID=UPI001B87C34E|nr:uncharacterized protein EDB91DRAFT_1330743 [Suillus paluster]KAG1728375.1 hypothetical protein EDB91DRAFT_1330743 [Suillus paluster]